MMKKKSYRIIAGILALAVFFCVQQLCLGWHDYRCFFRPGMSFLDKLIQFISHTWVLTYLALLVMSSVGVVVLLVLCKKAENGKKETEGKRNFRREHRKR